MGKDINIVEIFNNLDIPKSLGVGLIFGLLYYFAPFDGGAKLTRQIQEEQIKVNQKELEIKKIQAAFEDMEKFQKEIEEVAKNMLDFDEYFSETMPVLELQSSISEKAEQYTLVVNNMKPVERSSEFPAYQETAVSFDVEGNFHNVMEFLSELTQMKRAIDFSAMEFRTVVKGDFPIVSLKTEMVVYSSKPNEPAAPTPGGTPGVPPDPQQRPNNG